ncbi:MAG: dimethylarginine dimethylaminohydrolase family protein [Candidatus Anammoxibacter sp.]
MRILMCAPDFYGIEYEINPWMSVEVNADREKANVQWKELRNILTGRMGITVDLIDPVKGLPDMVFTANGGFIRDRIFISANFMYHERKEEEKYFISRFKSLGYNIVEPPIDVLYEGEGDMLVAKNSLFGGYRFRSDIKSHEWIGRILDMEVLSLELTDPRFYHLDTCFCPLPGGEVIYYPAAFDSYAISVINDFFPESKRIEVIQSEAVKFACNAVAVNDMVVTNTGCEKLKIDLEKIGYSVYRTELSEFIKAGGSAKCLTLITER